ncbi:MAG: indole-3-glycerol-phosphate synthase [Fervidobacterium sp.]|nr:indole-3-glycerol-phosphate synthase [Fervidobacterium sp.]
MLSFKQIRQEKINKYKKDNPHKFYNIFKDRGKGRIIAEFKRQSPSKGKLLQQENLQDILNDYEQAGVAAISILTDEQYFQGSITDLETARKITKLPILRKDFICLTKQICESAIYGADCVLLISELLSIKELQKLSTIATDLELDLLIEIHYLESYEKVKKLKVPYILGVNSRNLKTLQVSHKHALEVVKNLPSDIPLVIESGIEDEKDIEIYKPYKPSGFLIGTSLLKAINRVEKLSRIIKTAKN